MNTQTGSKDIWDRITALATILVPAAIALAGHFIAQGLKEAEIQNQELRAEQANALAVANTRIAQANLVNTSMKYLASNNPVERKLAIEAVLMGVPIEGVVFARILAESDSDPIVQAAAQNSLDQRISLLIKQLFSDQAEVRIKAAQDIAQGWNSDAEVVAALIDFANANMDNDNGIYNSVVVLNTFDLATLHTKRDKVLEFLESASKIGSKTKAEADRLMERIKG